MSQAIPNQVDSLPASPPPARGAARPEHSRWQALVQKAPTAVVFVALGALAWWGNTTHWTLPKLSSLIGEKEATAEKWCNDHGVPEAECIECKPELAPKLPDHGWCKVHGIQQCPFEHPDVAQLATTPKITDAQLAQAERALSIMPRAENNSRCSLQQKRIQFASMQAIEKAGVDIAIAQSHPIQEQIIANGEVTYDQTVTAHLASRVKGTAAKVFSQIGAEVQKGEILALIDSAEVGKAKSEFLEAIADSRLKSTNYERLERLGVGSVPGKSIREAEAELQLAQIRLRASEQALANLGLPASSEKFASANIEDISDSVRFLGLSRELANQLRSETQSSNLFPLRSPAAGMIVDCNLVAGEVVDTNEPLFELTDIRQMWLTLNVRQEDVKYLKTGQKVLFTPSGERQSKPIEGKLSWISSSADSQTRTVKVRAQLPNDRGDLRSNTFGTGRIILREEAAAVTVPTEAIHNDGCCHVVFVRDKDFFKENGPKFFHIRKVRPGVVQGEETEIIAGLLPGEIVASKNSVVLEAQLLKSNLGAGCCEAHAAKK